MLYDAKEQSKRRASQKSSTNKRGSTLLTEPTNQEKQHEELHTKNHGNFTVDSSLDTNERRQRKRTAERNAEEAQRPARTKRKRKDVSWDTTS